MMKPRFAFSQFFVFACILLSACQKDDDPAPVEAACRIQKEMNSDGNYVSYSYDAAGSPTKIEYHDPYVINRVLDIFHDYMTMTEMNRLHPTTLTTHYGVGFLTTLPDVGLISVTRDGDTQENWRSYFFHYDSKGRLDRVGEETEHIPGDDQWELLVTYNEQDNVTKMVYQLTTNVRNLSTVIMVDGFDSQHTPYAGVKAYRYLMSNWDNSDPGPIITALSKNNPTSFRLIVNEVETMKIAMEYQYNEHGFPLQRTVTHTNDAGKYTYGQTYEYICP